MLAALAAALTLAAASMEEPSETCFRKAPVTAELVAAARDNGLRHFPGGRGIPQFLLGHLSYLRDAALEQGAPSGSVLFVRDGAAWTALFPNEGDSALGVFVSASASRVVIVTQRQVEAPQPLFTIVASSDGLKTGSCAELTFPGALNHPTWAMETLELKEVQMNPRGRGRLIGSALIDAEDGDEGVLTWWRYATSDGGLTWSAPRRLARQPAPMGGDLLPVAEPAAESELEALTAYAAGR